MPNNLAIGPNSVVPKVAISFVTAGFTAINCSIIYKVGNPNQSWIPGRTFNPISGFELGNFGYYVVLLQAMDLASIVVPPIEEVTPTDDPIESFPFADPDVIATNGGATGTTGGGSPVVSITDKTITKFQLNIINGGSAYGGSGVLNFVHAVIKENDKDGSVLATKNRTGLAIPATSGSNDAVVDFVLDTPLVISGTKLLYIEYYCDYWCLERALATNPLAVNKGTFFISQLDELSRAYVDPATTAPNDYILWTKIFF